MEAWLHTDLDAVDRSLVEQLQADGRASYKQLATTAGIPEATARRRVNRLLDSGIVRVIGVLNTLASDRVSLALLEIGVDRDPEAVAEEIGQWPEVTWAALTLGSASIIVEVMCDGRDGVLDVIRRVHELEGTRDVRGTQYLKVVKALYAGPPPSSVLP